MTASKNPERLETIKRLTEQGYYLNQIANELGIAHQVVRFYEDRYRLKIPRATEKRGRPWSDDEVEYLIYAMEDHQIRLSEVAKELGRTTKAVSCKIQDLKDKGLLPEKAGVQWSDLDIAFLVKRYNRLPLEKLANKLGRTPGAVENKAGRLGLRKSYHCNLSEQIQALAEEGLYLNQIAKKLRIGHNLVIYYENTYGFKVPREPEDLRKERCKKTIRDFWNRFPVHYTGRY